MDARAFQNYVQANFSKPSVKPSPHDYETLWVLYIATAGLGGKTGEVLEHFKKWVRDGKPLGEELLLEMGDVLHYFTVLAWTAGFTLEQIMDANKAKLDVRYKRRPDPNTDFVRNADHKHRTLTEM